MERSIKKRAKKKEHLTWTSKTRTDAAPMISDQFSELSENVLCLRNFAVKESAVPCRLYVVGILFITPMIFYDLVMFLFRGSYELAAIFAAGLLFPAMIGAFMARHLPIICRHSNFYFNRHTKRVYWHDGKQLYVGDWNGVQVGPNAIRESTGNGVVVCFYLELMFPWVNAPPGTEWPECMVRLESNDVTHPHPALTAQVWEYIRHFMDQGPNDLPQPPEETWWWYQPPRKLYLTPKEALLRYLPWRTGVPGEREGKAWWTLPIWAVMFPYNMLLMLCWWATCKVFKVRAADPPPEAFEGGRVD